MDGVLTADHEVMAEAVDSFFSHLLGESAERDFTLNLEEIGMPRKVLDHLDRDFTEEEVLAAVRAQGLDKAPGPDGFPARFYVACWSVIKDDMMEAFGSLQRLDFRGLTSINQAFITLLPKTAAAMEIREFRPISLIHSFPKLVAKVLAIRLAEEMPDLVGAHQSAFIKGRWLHDNYMMVQGLARKLHATKKDAVMLKLDITKAFDTVNGAFLMDV